MNCRERREARRRNQHRRAAQRAYFRLPLSAQIRVSLNIFRAVPGLLEGFVHSQFARMAYVAGEAALGR